MKLFLFRPTLFPKKYVISFQRMITLAIGRSKRIEKIRIEPFNLPASP